MIPDIHEVLKHYPEFDGIHPACEAVPLMGEEKFESLVQSISERGLLEPLHRWHDRSLIDGRHRLLACYEAQQEIRVIDVPDGVDAIEFVADKNFERNEFTTGQKAAYVFAMWEWEAEKAKERQLRKPADSVPEELPEQKGDTRDRLGQKVGISGKSVDKFRKIVEFVPDVAEEVKSGKVSLENGFSLAKKKERELKLQPIDDSESALSVEMTTIVTARGVESEIPLPKKVVFNQTNDSVDWARWTWNPVTGCEHGCKFCYAREIAHMKRMEAYYPNQFEPTFHPYRLDAPKNTSIPDSDDERDGRVFVCSMADLFGKWVPEKWVKSVFDACLDSPEWQYLFLTKYPQRYAKLPLIPRAWYGSSVIQQSDVSRVEKQMQQFSESDVVRWISLEPMLEPITFKDLSWCNLVVIGSQTSTNQPDGNVPEFAPEFDWIVDVVNQCREFGVPYYLKANLGMERPGMNLPKGVPS